MQKVDGVKKAIRQTRTFGEWAGTLEISVDAFQLQEQHQAGKQLSSGISSLNVHHAQIYAKDYS